MESYQPSRETAAPELPFLVTAYLADDSGTLRPAMMPTACPMSDGSEECCITLDYHRPRKTGPCIPVAVLECTTHERHFTVYPCGHVPYGREAVAPVGLDGRVLSAASPATAEAEEPEPRPLWRQTRFAAVLDAAQGKAWPRDSPGPCWTTQLQRLDELAALLGLEPTPPAAVGEKLALLLDVPRLSLIDDAGRLAQAVGFEARGVILVATLERASKGRLILDRVLACGALSGLWRPARLWRTPDNPQCTVFPGRGTPSG